MSGGHAGILYTASFWRNAEGEEKGGNVRLLLWQSLTSAVLNYGGEKVGRKDSFHKTWQKKSDSISLKSLRKEKKKKRIGKKSFPPLNLSFGPHLL